MFANCEGATDEDWQKVVDNMGLVYHCLNRMGGFFTDRDREDAEQDGIFGLLRAAQKYDPGTGFRFSTYAHAWINQSIQRGRRNRGEHVDRNDRTVSDVLSLDHHQDGTASIGDFLEASDDIEADVEYQLLLSGVQDACRDGLDREILRAAIEGSPVASIGPKYGLTREAGRRRKVQLARRAAPLVVLSREVGSISPSGRW